MSSDNAPMAGNNSRPCVANVVNPFRNTASNVKTATSQTASQRSNRRPRVLVVMSAYMEDYASHPQSGQKLDDP